MMLSLWRDGCRLNSTTSPSTKCLSTMSPYWRRCRDTRHKYRCCCHRKSTVQVGHTSHWSCDPTIAFYLQLLCTVYGYLSTTHAYMSVQDLGKKNYAKLTSYGQGHTSNLLGLISYQPLILLLLFFYHHTSKIYKMEEQIIHHCTLRYLCFMLNFTFWRSDLSVGWSLPRDVCLVHWSPASAESQCWTLSPFQDRRASWQPVEALPP